MTTPNLNDNDQEPVPVVPGAPDGNNGKTHLTAEDMFGDGADRDHITSTPLAPIVQSPPLQIHVSGVVATTTVGKYIYLNAEGGFAKEDKGRGYAGQAFVYAFPSFHEYWMWKQTLNPTISLLCGTFDVKNHLAQFTTKENVAYIPGAVASTKEFLDFRPGIPSVLHIDLDVKRADEVAALYPESPITFDTHEAAVDVLLDVAPWLKDVALGVSDSSSSMVMNDAGEWLRGRGGLRIDFAVDDGSKIPEILDHIDTLCWAKGYGWGFIDKAAGIQYRSLVDSVMKTVTQPDFVNPQYGEGCYGQREFNEFNSDGGVLCTATIPSLTHEELTAARLHKDAMEAEFAPRRAVLKVEYDAKRHANMRQVRPDLSDEDANDISLKLQSGVFYGPAQITMADDSVVTADQLVLDGSGFDVMDCSDPEEPDYRESTLMARFYWNNGGDPRIHSFVHGGGKYKVRLSCTAYKEVIEAQPDMEFHERARLKALVEEDEQVKLVEGEAQDLINSAGTITPGDSASLRVLIRGLAEIDDPITTAEVKRIVLKNDVIKAREFNAALTKNKKEIADAAPKQGVPRSVNGEGQPVVDNKVATLAKAYLELLARNNVLMVNYQGVLYFYEKGGYTETEPVWLSNRLTKFLPSCQFENEKTKAWEAVDTPRRVVGDVASAVMAEFHEERWRETLPFWRYDDLNPAYHVPSKNLMTFQNGLLDVRSRDLHPPSPAFLSINTLPFSYDPDAGEPVRWKKFLKEVWPNDEDSRYLLQEIFGYILSGQTDLHKIFILIGMRRGGKGTIGRILTYIIGLINVASVTLQAISNTNDFGGAGLIGKMLWLLGDARLGKGVDQGKVVQWFLNISGEDNVSVARKHIGEWNGRLRCNIMILANEMPKLFDAAGALQSRIIPLKFTQTFEGREERDLESQLQAEASGIILWALEGLERLTLNGGKFTESVDKVEMLDHFESLANPLHDFIGEKIVADFDPEKAVWCDDLYRMWLSFRVDNDINMGGSKRQFNELLRSALPHVTVYRPDARFDGGPRQRAFRGIRYATDEERNAYIDSKNSVTL